MQTIQDTIHQIRATSDDQALSTLCDTIYQKASSKQRKEAALEGIKYLIKQAEAQERGAPMAESQPTTATSEPPRSGKHNASGRMQGAPQAILDRIVRFDSGAWCRWGDLTIELLDELIEDYTRKIGGYLQNKERYQALSNAMTAAQVDFARELGEDRVAEVMNV